LYCLGRGHSASMTLCVSDLRQVSGFPCVLHFPPRINLTITPTITPLWGYAFLKSWLFFSFSFDNKTICRLLVSESILKARYLLLTFYTFQIGNWCHNTVEQKRFEDIGIISSYGLNLVVWCLAPLSTIVQLYRSGQFYW